MGRQSGRWRALLAGVVTLAGAGLVASTPAHAVSGGTPITDDTFAFAAKVSFDGVSGCSAALVAPQYVITTKSCLSATGAPVVTGAPAKPITVTVGRLDLTSSAGHVRRATWVVPHPSRNVTLLRLAGRAVGVTPVVLGTTAPAAGETFQALGFGRTATEWVPDKLHGVLVTADAVSATGIDISPESGGPTTCRGDAGGPTVRLGGGTPQLVALHDTSWQGGCLGETETRRNAVEARTDDLAAWVRQHSVSTCNAGGGTAVPGNQGSIAILGDWTGDCRADALAQPADGRLRLFPSSYLSGTVYPEPTAAPYVGSGWLAATRPRVLVGDFNGDGRSDLIGGVADGTLTAWASTGDLSANYKLFAGASAVVGNGFTISAIPQLLPGDFDGDGRTDLLAQLADGTLRVWASTGDLSADGRLFSGAPRDVGSGFTATAVLRILTGDFNGDGRTDLIAQYADGSMKAYPSSGDLSANLRLFPSTQQAKVVGTGWTSSAIPRILPGDVDGDAITDLVAQSADGTLRAYRSTGDLTTVLFPGPYRQVGANWSAANRPRIMVGDFSGDGRTDLVAQQSVGSLSSFRATGDLSADDKLYVSGQPPRGEGNWGSADILRIF